ncbi:NAD(P)-dependent glycerol-1-phosphate dehydrogenase [Halococcoides cellulosivorans]|uniref:Glycerol-1-phosphate dehydrogenase [NAD(P)+] n=1 Tax=Halococcoides cellulosivorans TaxID=1679096 RepID=A0A2R4X1E2_9EURY|nr:NAD(P)-dependent glycerol-1-phosphate dehydrogenase [Halococcoides cellulosivorans]AWB27595.1 NAD(P)-dependent glycerol-1-phosphate dehydrogenase [Halococcoides cellulosivorans]
MFEKSTWIRLPRTVRVGHDVLDSIGEALDDPALNGRPLVVTGPIPREVAGDRVLDQLTASGHDPAVVEPKGTSYSAVETTIEAARECDAGYLLAIGGGRPIDIAKMAADDIGVGFVSVPTAPSHDGIVSGRASMPDGDTRHSVAADPPLAVIADTRVLADAPWRLTTAGCADIISNYTAVRDWELARRLRNETYSEYAGALSRMTAEMLVENADSIKQGLEESAWIVVKALLSSGVAMSIAGSSRPASGAEHLFSHQLDRLADDPALHGHQVGVGTIVVAYLHSGPDGFWEDIRAALTAIDAPTTAAELGIDPETAVDALATAHRIRDRYTILGDGISRSAAREALTVTDVIE